MASGKKKRSKGVMMSMRSAPTKKSKPPRSPVLRGLQWLGGGAFIVVVLAIVVLLAMQLLAPRMGAEVDEVDVPVVDILGRETVIGDLDVAVVEIGGVRVKVPLDAPRRESVDVDTWLHVRYEVLPAVQTVTVLDWYVTDAPAGANVEEAEPAGAEASTGGAADAS